MLCETTHDIVFVRGYLSHAPQEIEKAWKMVDASHEKEARAKETISQLKTEISNLSRLVEQGAGLSVGQVHIVVHHHVSGI